MAKKPAKVPDTGPVRSKRKLTLPRGNPTKRGKVFGNWQERRTRGKG